MRDQFITMALCAAFLFVPVSSLIAASDSDGPRKRAVQNLETDRLKEKKQKEARAAPADLMKKLERDRRNQRAVDVNIANQIETLRDLIETAPSQDPDLPRYLLSLGDVYWDKADTYYDRAYDLELEKALFEAEQRGDKPALRKLKLRQAELLSKEFQWRKRSIELYRSIEDKFPFYEDLAMVFYYLGYQLLQLEQPDEAKDYFVKVLKQPLSIYTPDALYHLAEYYFARHDYGTALKIYAKVEEFPKAISYATSLYKQGWCLYNMEEYQDSVGAFLRVIEYARSDAAKNLGYRFELIADAQQDLVRAYAEVADPDEALSFFGKVAPKLQIELTEVLAQLLFEKSAIYDSLALYKALAKKKKKDPRRALYWLGVAECAYRLGDRKTVLKTIRDSLSHYRGLSSGPLPVAHKLASHLSRRDRRELYTRLEGLLKTAATSYHIEAESKGNEEEYAETAYLYDAYLALFPDSEDAYDITWNIALLNEHMERWDEAGELYEIVYDMAPFGTHAAESAKAILLSYYNSVQENKSDIKDNEAIDLSYKPYPADYEKMLEAAARFIETSWESDPEVSKAHYVAAQAAYRFNHFDEAIPHLRAILDKFPNDPLVPSAAHMLLSCFSLQRDIDRLSAWADKLAKDSNINRGKLASLISEIRGQSGFNQCFRLEKERDFLKSARCFEEYVQSFPDTKLKTRAYLHAASAYFRAKLVDKSLHNLEDLYESAPDDPLAPTALFSIAEILRSIAVYSESARVYELYAEYHPKHKNVKIALQRAIVFRKALRDYDQALKNIETYEDRFSEDPALPGLALEKAIIARRADKLDLAEKTLKNTLKSPPKGTTRDQLFKTRLELGRTLLMQREGREARETFISNTRLFAGLPYHKKRKVTSEGVAAVAESHFLLGQMVLQRMEGLEFRGNAKAVGKTLVEKLKLIKESNEIFAKVIRYGNRNWTIAGFARTARAFEALAERIINAPVPREFRGEAAEVYRQTLSDQAEPIQKKATKSYREALKLAMDLQWFNTYAQEAVEALARLDYSFAFTKEFALKPHQIRPMGAVPSIASITEAEEGAEALESVPPAEPPKAR